MKQFYAVIETSKQKTEFARTIDSTSVAYRTQQPNPTPQINIEIKTAKQNHYSMNKIKTKRKRGR